MIGTKFNRKIGKTLHDNKLEESLYNDSKVLPKLTNVSQAPYERMPTLREKSEVFKTYKKQVPVIGGNGEPDVAMEDALSGPAELKRRMLGGAKSNLSFSKTLQVADGLERADKTNDGLKPVKRAKKVIEGSVPLAREQLNSVKLTGGASDLEKLRAVGPVAKNTVKQVKTGDLPIPTAEKVVVKTAVKRGGGRKPKDAPVAPALSWNALLKKVCSEQKCSLKGAMAYIKEKNLYQKKATP
jgi:hypothetical protein